MTKTVLLGTTKDSGHQNHIILQSNFAEDTTEDLLYEFLNEKTPQTKKSYRIDVKHFFKFTNKNFGVPRIQGQQANFADIKRVHVVKYRNHLESNPCRTGRPLAPNSINRKLSSIASFFHFLLQREIIEKNPMMFCKRPPRILVRPTEAFNDKEMRDLFSLVLKKAPPMHSLVILTIFTTGMRNAEIRSIRLRDFNGEQGIRTLKYIGKGSKQCEIAIHPATAFYMDEYLKWMKEQGRPLRKDDYLFQPTKRLGKFENENLCKMGDESSGARFSKQNKKLSATALGYIVKKWSRQINPNKRISPHSGRASFITSLLANGVDLYQVSQAVSHSDTRVTARYNEQNKKFKQSPVFIMDLF